MSLTNRRIPPDPPIRHTNTTRAMKPMQSVTTPFSNGPNQLLTTTTKPASEMITSPIADTKIPQPSMEDTVDSSEPATSMSDPYSAGSSSKSVIRKKEAAPAHSPTLTPTSTIPTSNVVPWIATNSPSPSAVNSIPKSQKIIAPTNTMKIGSLITINLLKGLRSTANSQSAFQNIIYFIIMMII